jgi:hypothetical protein
VIANVPDHAIDQVVLESQHIGEGRGTVPVCKSLW